MHRAAQQLPRLHGRAIEATQPHCPQLTCHEDYGGVHRGGLLEEPGRLLSGQRRQQPMLHKHAVKCNCAARKACLGRLHAGDRPHCRAGGVAAGRWAGSEGAGGLPSGGLAAAAAAALGDGRLPAQLEPQRALIVASWCQQRAAALDRREGERGVSGRTVVLLLRQGGLGVVMGRAIVHQQDLEALQLAAGRPGV